jgi:hypothetical protein
MHTWPGLRRISVVLGQYWLSLLIGVLTRGGIRWGPATVSQFTIHLRGREMPARELGYAEGVLAIFQGVLLLCVGGVLAFAALHAPLAIRIGLCVAVLVLGATATRTLRELTVVQDGDSPARRDTTAQEVVA